MAKGIGIKFIMGILIGLLALIIIAAIVFKLFGNQLIRTGIIAGGQKALQVDMRLDSIDLKLFAGEVNLKGMEIDNPEGYNHPTFVTLEHAYVGVNVSSLMSDTIEIDKIQLDDIYLTIEQKGTTNNLQQILDNLPKSEPKKPVPGSEREAAGKKNLSIKVLEINNIEVKAKLLPIPGRADTVTLRLKPIRLENLGTGQKFDMADLTARILMAISRGIAEQGRELLPTDMINSIGDELGKQGEQLLRSGQEAGQQLLEGTKDIGKGAADTIKDLGGLFRKKDQPEEPKE